MGREAIKSRKGESEGVNDESNRSNSSGVEADFPLTQLPPAWAKTLDKKMPLFRPCAG